MQDIFRQGDVVIRRINKLPRGLKKKSNTILAYGEITGHNHALDIDVKDLNFNILVDKSGKIYFQNDKPINLNHQEHKQITIEKGSFEVIIERERDPFLQNIRQVID